MARKAAKKTVGTKKARKAKPVEAEDRFEEVAQEAPEAPTQIPMKVGYAVAISKEGEFVFEIFGEEQGLVEVMGLHSFADLKIKQILNAKQMTGDALVHEVGKAVQALHQKMDGEEPEEE